MTVIGWQDTTYVNQMNTWLKYFLIRSGEGYTIQQAIEYADERVSIEHNQYMGGLDNKLVAGNVTQKLVW